VTRWPQHTIGEIVDHAGGLVQTGPFGSQLHRSDYTNGDGVALVMPKDMVGGRIDYSSTAIVNPHKAAEMRRHACEPLDVLLARRGDIGRCVLVRDDDAGVLCGTGSIRISVKGSALIPEFLFYFLSSNRGREELESRSVGATMANLSATAVRLVRVPTPPLDIQRKVASVLSAYDDLIENNGRRIELLEEAARRIYREWFVELRYPGHLQSGVVDSRLGSLPAGWKAVPLGEELDVIEAGSRPRGCIDPSEDGVPSVGAENVQGLGRYYYSKEKYISRAFFESMRRGRVMDGDVLLYKDGAYIGRTSFFGNGFPHSVCAINEHVFRLRATRLPQTFLYFWLSAADTTRRVRALNTNAAQPGLNQASVKGLEIVVPSEDVVGAFDRLAYPLVSAALNRAAASRKLQLARDVLLPRLMSGQIDVDELDIEVAESAA
jgi:type I restriction enzyme S subunit